MSLFIGIDGGGSKTKAVLCDDTLKVLFETQSDASNFLIIGTEIVSKTIIKLLIDCCNSQNISTSQIIGTVLGTTGAGRESDAQKLEEAVYAEALSQKLQLNSFKVVSDARIALEGAFSSLPGSILIAGTGSIMFGKDKQGIIHRVGGYGRLIGDEGSGLSIGKKGINIVAKYYDGRGQNSLLIKIVEKQFDIFNQNQLISKVYSDEIKIQQIAPLVMKAADQGDELCQDILAEETDELIMHIVAMTKKLKEENMKLVFIGGTITNENSYSKMLKEKIKLFLPHIIVKQPDYPPEIGAVIMAKQN